MRFAYDILQGNLVGENNSLIKSLWSLKVILSALHFLWSALLDKILTKVNLVKKKGCKRITCYAHYVRKKMRQPLT